MEFINYQKKRKKKKKTSKQNFFFPSEAHLESLRFQGKCNFCMDRVFRKILTMDLRKHNIAMLSGVVCVGRIGKLPIICIYKSGDKSSTIRLFKVKFFFTNL